MITNNRYENKYGDTYTFNPIIEDNAGSYIGRLQIMRNGEEIELIRMGSCSSKSDMLLNIDNEKLRVVERKKLKLIKLSEYDKQAISFLNKTNTSISFTYLGHKKHFDTDKDYRACFEVTISRENRKPMVFNFGNSIVNSYNFMTNENRSPMLMFPVKKGASHNYIKYFDLTKPITGRATVETMEGTVQIKLNKTPPSEYSVLTCLQKYNVGSFEDFCSEYGYDTDSMTANKTYLAVQKEYNDLLNLGFTDSQMEELQEVA